MDVKGFVYVTGASWGGKSAFDYATIAYDNRGNQLWVARYDGPASEMDVATSVAVDVSGYVYVTGKSAGIDTNLDYATLKYDPAGNELWVARYNGSANDEDIATAVAVDTGGNVYVTGESVGVGTSFDMVTVKYDADGNELWVAKYNGPANSADTATALAVDAEGNVYVTGMSVGIGTSSDFITIKYDTNGKQLWAARRNSYGDFDGASALALDKQGNVYVTGRSVGIDTESDYLTIKYSPDGEEIWVARYDGPAHRYDRATAVKVDEEGNVYVTGMSSGVGTGYDYATVKYDGSGNELWVARYDGPASRNDAAHALATANDGAVYVTGRSTGIGTGFDFATVKYDSQGNQIWVIRYEGPGNDSAYALALDPSGDVYVAGESWGETTDLDYAVVKYVQR